jgi:hypothetical protein
LKKNIGEAMAARSIQKLMNEVAHYAKEGKGFRK